MPVLKEIRLVGDLGLSDREHALPKHELMNVNKLLPLIQCFKDDRDQERKVADSKSTNGYPTCAFSFLGRQVMGLGAKRWRGCLVGVFGGGEGRRLTLNFFFFWFLDTISRPCLGLVWGFLLV